MSTQNHFNSTLPEHSLKKAAAIAPDQVVAMLINADHVMLEGFGGVTQKLPFWVPSAEGTSVFGGNENIRLKREFFSRLQWSVLFIIVCSLTLLAMLTISQNTPHTAQAPWRVKSVEAQALSVWVGQADQGVSLLVPVGAMLPSGEILLSIDVAGQSFSTDSQTTVVKK